MKNELFVVILSILVLIAITGCRLSEGDAVKPSSVVCVTETEGVAQSVHIHNPETEPQDKSLDGSSKRPQWRIRQTDLEKSVIQCLDDFNAIRPGMTRREVEEKFPIDGGIHTVSPVRFLHPDCYYFKVDVSFSYETDPTNQNRAIWSGVDKVICVSAPYIEYPYSD